MKTIEEVVQDLIDDVSHDWGDIYWVPFTVEEDDKKFLVFGNIQSKYSQIERARLRGVDEVVGHYVEGNIPLYASDAEQRRIYDLINQNRKDYVNALNAWAESDVNRFDGALRRALNANHKIVSASFECYPFTFDEVSAF